MSYRDQNHNTVLTRESVGTDVLLEPTSAGHLRNLFSPHPGAWLLGLSMLLNTIFIVPGEVNVFSTLLYTLQNNDLAKPIPSTIENALDSNTNTSQPTSPPPSQTGLDT